jgi:hypothetical protein
MAEVLTKKLDSNPYSTVSGLRAHTRGQVLGRTSSCLVAPAMDSRAKYVPPNANVFFPIP